MLPENLAERMKEAGLTSGGFYRHFDSREELVAEAVECALLDGGERAAEAISRGKKAPLAALIAAYLSPAHRDAFATGCAVVALASDVSRSNEKAQAVEQRRARRRLLAGLRRMRPDWRRQTGVVRAVKAVELDAVRQGERHSSVSGSGRNMELQ